MRRMALATLAAIVMLSVATTSSCGFERPPYGGEKESALAAATVAPDLTKVQALLASGADPNKMVVHEGHYHSPWALALHQLRPGHPELVRIVRAMLESGANPGSAWGSVKARGGLYSRVEQSAVLIAMLHPDEDVVRAIIEAGLNPRLGQTALVMAIETGQSRIAHLLVDGGVDPNCHPGALTPLVAAIEARDVAMMTYLEEHGARERP
jgi:hypothetical protein